MSIDYQEIARYKRREMSNRVIAELLHISRNSVNRAVQRINASGLSYTDVVNLSVQEVNDSFFKATGQKNSRLCNA